MNGKDESERTGKGACRPEQGDFDAAPSEWF